MERCYYNDREGIYHASEETECPEGVECEAKFNTHGDGLSMLTPYDNAVGIIDVIAEAWQQWVNRENELYTAWAEKQAEKRELRI